MCYHISMKMIKAFMTDGGEIFTTPEEAQEHEIRQYLAMECIHFEDDKWKPFWARRIEVIAILQSIDQPEKVVEEKIGNEYGHCMTCGDLYLKSQMHSMPIINHPHGVAFKCETCWNISIRA